MEFDPVSFLTQGAAQAPAVIFFVWAITFFAGRFGASGKVQLGIALGSGFLLGGGLLAADQGWPRDYQGWFFLFVYSGLMAATPSLLYEQGKAMLAKAGDQLLASFTKYINKG